MGIKSNILINVDVRKAIADYGRLLTAANKTNQGITQGANKAKMSVDQLGGTITKTTQGAAAGAVGFQTMSMGMLNLSTSAVQTFTSLSNLDRVQNRAAASAVGLQRAQDLLARKQVQLVKLQEAGNGAGRDAVLITKEIATATADLAVKTDKLKIEQGAVTDVYMLFFANIANVGVSTMMVLSNMMSAEQITRVKQIITTKAHTISLKWNALANWSNTRSLIASNHAGGMNVVALTGQTIATRIATVATRALTFAMGPVGIAIMAIAAVVAILTTNMFGVTDAIKGFLGIELESTKAVDDGTLAINEQTAALDKQNKSYKDMTQPMQNYIKMMKEAALQSGDLSRIKHAAQIGVGGGSGFSPGVGSPNYSSGGATGSGISAGGGGDTGSFTSTNTVGGSDRFSSSVGAGKAIPGQSVVETVQDLSAPYVSRRGSENRYKSSFEASNEPSAERGDIGTSGRRGSVNSMYQGSTGGDLAFGDNGLYLTSNTMFTGLSSSHQSRTTGRNGVPITTAAETPTPWVQPSGGRFSRNKPNVATPVINTSSSSNYESNMYGALGSAEGAMQFYSLSPPEQELWLIGELEKHSEDSPQFNEIMELARVTSLETENFTMESPARKAMNIESVKGADNFLGGVDNISSELGGYRPTGMSESITSNRSGLAFFLQGKDKLDPSRTIFHAGTGGLEIAQNMLAGNKNFGRSSGMVAALSRLQAQGLDFTKTNTNMNFRSLGGAYGTPAEQAIRGMELMNRGYNVSSGGRGYSQSEINNGANANTTWNGGGWDRSAFDAANAYADMMANTGLGNRIKSAGNVFGVTQQLGVGYRSNLPSPVHWAKYDTTTAMARTFGSDEIAKQEMIDAKIRFDTNMASGRPGGIIPFINAYYEETQQIAARSNTRAASKTQSIGIDFDPNANEGWWERRVAPGSKGVVRVYWNKTSLSSEGQIRADIQASASVTLPSVTRLIAISESFANNGKYTNFNNTAITQDAMAKLGMTEQAVFDIRFESTRGDRELENRMRHIEQQAASSSGTSPL